MIANLICAASWVLLIMLATRAILSWFPLAPGGIAAQINTLMFRATEPLLGPLRRALPPVGVIDLSFLVVFLAIVILQRFVC
jgi:YggT family protein